MNVLANDDELLKYIEIWNKIKLLLNKILYNWLVYEEYIRTKISPYNENFHGNKRLTKDIEAENKFYSRIFLGKFFKCNAIEKHNKNSFFKELVQIADCSVNESNN